MVWLSTGVRADVFDRHMMKRNDRIVVWRWWRMGSVGEYQKRAEQCTERALLVTRADDRARWLELADEWAALSRIEFQKLPVRRDQPTALWRGGK